MMEVLIFFRLPNIVTFSLSESSAEVASSRRRTDGSRTCVTKLLVFVITGLSENVGWCGTNAFAIAMVLLR